MKFNYSFLLALLIVSSFSINMVSGFDWTNQVIGDWNFNEGSGTLAKDTRSLTNLTLISTAWTAGKVGTSAARLNGISSYGNFLNQSNVNLLANFTIAVWVNATCPPATCVIVGRDGAGANNQYRMLSHRTDASVGTSGADATTGGLLPDLRIWRFLVGTFDGVNLRFYVNGTLFATTPASISQTYFNTTLGARAAGTANFFSGDIDQMTIWNRTLSGAEITELYNNGVGTEFNLPANVVTLISPANSLNATPQNFNSNIFNATLTAWTNLANATLFIYNSTGVVNRTTQILTGSNNGTSINVLGLTIGSYLWNVLGCNASNSCAFAPANFSFNVANTIDIASETWNNITFEGVSNGFFITQINYNSSLFTNVVGTLVYNGSRYLGTSTITGSNATFTRVINAPLVTANTNFSFYWEFLVNDGVNTFFVNSTSHLQQVNNLLIDNCTINTNLIYNFTLKDEETQTIFNFTSLNSTIDVGLTLSSLDKSLSVATFNQSFVRVNPARVCINFNLANASYRVDGVARYVASSYSDERYNIQNFTLSSSNIPQNINLLDLLIIDAQQFKIVYRNANLLNVPNVIIQIERQYISLNNFSIIEIPLTDSQGSTIASLVPNIVVYNFKVYSEGQLLDEFLNVRAICNNILIGDCVITLNSQGGLNSPPDFTNYLGVNYINYYNPSSRIYTLNFTIADGSTQLISINVTDADNNPICSNSLSAPFGSISCTIPISYGNSTAIARGFVNNQLLFTDLFNVGTTSQLFDKGIYFFVFLLIITLPMMVGFSATGTLVFFVIGLISAGSLAFLDLGGWFGTSSAFLWFILAVGILLWKLNSGRSS